MIETDAYYYIVRLDQAFDQEATESEKESIIAERENENYNGKVQEWTDASTVETTSAWENIRVTDKDLYVVKTEDASSDSSSDSAESSSSSSSSGADSSGSADTASTSSSSTVE